MNVLVRKTNCIRNECSAIDSMKQIKSHINTMREGIDKAPERPDTWENTLIEASRNFQTPILYERSRSTRIRTVDMKTTGCGSNDHPTQLEKLNSAEIVAKKQRWKISSTSRKAKE